MHTRLVAALAAVATAGSISLAVAAPQITNVLPERGPTAGNAIITIFGAGFAPAGNSVTVGSSPCQVTGESAATILCTLPEGSGASRPIRVIDGVGTASPPYPFAYAPPEVTNVTAASAPTAGGVLITINGTNFGADGVARRVTIGDSVACGAPSTLTPHEAVTCTLPPGQGVGLPVEVTVDGQSSTTNGALSYDPPAITGVTPTRGPAAGGFPITIVGSDFGRTGASVIVGAALCPVDVQTDDRLECELPPASPGAPAYVRVIIGGQASNAVPFSYQPVASKCDAGKLKAVTGYAKCLGTAEANAAKKGIDVAAATVGKCDEKMDAACAKAESASSDCSQPGTCDALKSRTRRKGWDGVIYGSTR